MRSFIRRHVAFLGLILLSTAYSVWGISLVPFHPDETSLLFQSRDLEALFTAPASLAWQPDRAMDTASTYRALNAPLGKYVLGLGRLLTGFGVTDVGVDWDWSKSWQANVAAGAVPSPRLLWGARLASTLLLPFSLMSLYASGYRLGGRALGLLAALGLATNALILLHSRRAMAEGTLTFGVCFAMFTFLDGHRRPWLAGLGAALAFSAKQSAVALLLAGLLAVLWVQGDIPRRALRMLRNAALYLLTAGLVIFMLTPFLWAHPIGATGAAFRARQEFLAGQVKTLQAQLPEQVMRSPWVRGEFLIYALYLSPPQFIEAGNYEAVSGQAEADYLATPGHNLLRGVAGGGLMLTLTLIGMALAAVNARRISATSRVVGVLLLATALQGTALLVAVPIPYQRYVIPLVPFVCLWSAYALAVAPFTSRRAKGTASGPAGV